ncbi:UDP-forming cellulose synthase catalytic subunit [Leptothrix discophora]|uniref:Cellulose synthase catalytic subunit [UDP-forming] n=1 Tax=Leptothrix discophora TaxID=89 RepID=A0ABT9G175_LEPDI|nr:UDP-forming cellulose synthase catalytic subunit [Leptothrix discophora]MDP4300241.1 UDP-forming cellulose synthase catalytic subunit [Leptothrix discophora]
MNRWARALQVEQPDDWRCWLKRLFVLPPQRHRARLSRHDRQVLRASREPAPARLPTAVAARSATRDGPTTAPAPLSRETAPIRRQRIGVLRRGSSAANGGPSEGGIAFGQVGAAVPPMPQHAPAAPAAVSASASASATAEPHPDGRPGWRQWLARSSPARSFARIGELWRKLDFSPLARVLERWSDLPMWRRRPVRIGLGVLAAAALWLAASTPLSPFGQFLFFLAMLGLVLVVRRIPGNLPTLLLVSLAMLASCRYGWWRVSESLDFNPGWEAVLGTGLLLAELYAWLVMVLGFLQTSRPLKRPIVPIELPRDQWPTVDVFIPTYNEPMSVVGPTVLAARDLDWPADRLRIHLLDDGRRPEMKAFAEEAGVNYLTRSDNRHAKAGNLNAAMTVTQGEYIAIFDCDHMPVRGFLIHTMGWLLRDSRCALVQTPHHFFSPDPFERNLDTFRRVPNEGVLFYGLVQDGNDVWNASFFCGSCAVIRRSALDEIGGIAVETVTEDAHTALKLHRRGWRTAYLNETLAAGLATESLSGHVRQRIRWARGMAQIFRIDCPLLGPGLKPMQRLCYSNAMLHFFYGLPRLVFLTAPLGYLFFEFHIIHAQVGTLLLYLLPHLVLPHIANAHIAGPHRHTFWSELYETVLAWYVAVPTTAALFNPRGGNFDVTAKGGLIEQTHVDWHIARPYFALVLLNAAGLLFGLGRLLIYPWEWGTILLNMLWTVYNLLALGAAIGVARERRQVRRNTRVTSRLRAELMTPDGALLACETEDYALAGVGLRGVSPDLALPTGQTLGLRLFDEGRPQLLPVQVVSHRGDRLALKFGRLNLDQQAALIRCTFTRKDAWQNWQLSPESDRAMHGLIEIAKLGWSSYALLIRNALGHVRDGAAGWRSDAGAWVGTRAARLRRAIERS